MSDGTPKLVYEASDVADFCSTDVATIYTWVKKGEIPFFKTPGGRLRFTRESVLDFLRKYKFPIPAELSAGRPRVIAVDDDAQWRSQVKRSLSRAFDVVSFSDPYDALLAVGDQKPDAVVVDIRMPGIDGVHLIRRIRAAEQLNHTRIVVFSGYESERKACLDAGASDFVAKPAVEELVTRLKHALGMH